MNVEIGINEDWNFIAKRARSRWLAGGSGDCGVSVDLPHCWNDRDAFQENVSYYRGYGSYRKRFVLPARSQWPDGMIWMLESEGFYGTGDVWLNNRKLGTVDGEYLGFSFDVGSLLRWQSENVLGIRLTNRCASHVLPGISMPDFLLYGGLSGRVFIRGLPDLHVARDSVKIEYADILGDPVNVGVHYSVVNRSGSDRACTVEWRIIGPDGTESAAEPVQVQLKAGADTGLLQARVAVNSPGLWSAGNPVLYSAACSMVGEGRQVDAFERRFGIREAVFRPHEGFFLNGERVELRGCNRHESMPGFGRAMPPELHRADAELIRNLGLNFVRLSHYPQHPAFLDACDELGLMVYAELASWKSVKRGAWLESACRQFGRMIVRDRNHPCVIIWGMGNESRNRAAYLELRAMAESLDPARPVTYAENHFYRARRRKTAGIPDVWGANYELDMLQEGCNAGRMKSVVVTECSNCPHTHRGDAAEELRQVQTIEKDLGEMTAKPFVAGYALWSFSDYSTLRKERYRRESGIVDAWRVPKMSAALLQAMYLDRPFVRVYGDWGLTGSSAEQGRIRTVHIFTNCGSVTVLRNGAEVRSISCGFHAEEDIEFEPGELVVRGSKDGHAIEDRLLSYGAAVGVEVLPEKARVNASVRETVGVGIQVVDERARRVCSWHGDAVLSVEGEGAARCYRGDGAVVIRGGTGRCFVTASGREGMITVTASVKGLAQGSVQIQSVISGTAI